jgi:Ca2+-binding RTX toxin-like protein
MADNFLLTPLDTQSDQLIYAANGLSDTAFLTTKTLARRQSELFLETGTQSIDIGSRTLSSSRFVQQEVAMSGRKVAWDSYEGGEPKIKYYNGTKTLELGAGVDPKFYKQGIVWTNSAGLQYFNGQTTQQLSNISSGIDHSIQVSGNNIVWIGTDGTNRQLYFYNGSTTKQITTDGFNRIGSRDPRPEFELSGNQVVWSAYAHRSDGTIDRNNRNVYYFDGSTTKQLTNSPTVESQVHFYQGKPFWLGIDANGNQQIFGYENGKTKQITTEQNNAYEYKVIDGLLTWEHYDPVKEQTDVYTYNGTKVVNLTNTPNSSETILQQGDRLGWQSSDGQVSYLVNGQVKKIDLGEGNYEVITNKDGKLLLQGYQGLGLADQEFSGIYRGTAFESSKIQRGTVEDDRLVGKLTSNIIYGLDGDDRLIGGGGTDNLYGGNGDDKIDGKGGNDLVFGGAGDDQINGDAGSDVLVGGAGDDTLRGGTGNDKLHGGLGADEIDGGDGNDSIEGGAGNDQIRGGKGNDTIFGTLGDDEIHGGSGNDKIYANGGEIYGDAGNDYLTGGDKIAVIEGGDGNDTIFGGYGFTTPLLTGVEIHGDGGDDQITGRQGNDEIDGGTGNDVIVGEAGNDYIEGGRGNDRLTGAIGDDTLSGGAGSDTFVFENFGQTFTTEIGLDQILDFNVATDKILLQRGYLEPTDPFTTTLSFASVAQDSDVATNSALIVYSKGSGGLFYNANGTTAGLGNGAEFAILENQPQNLVASNFTIA